MWIHHMMALHHFPLPLPLPPLVILGLHFTMDPHPMVSRCVRTLFSLNKLRCCTFVSFHRFYALCWCHSPLGRGVYYGRQVREFWNWKSLLEQLFQTSWDLTHLDLLLFYICLDHLPTNCKITSCKKACSQIRQDIWSLIEEENTWPTYMHLLESHKLMKKPWTVNLHC